MDKFPPNPPPNRLDSSLEKISRIRKTHLQHQDVISQRRAFFKNQVSKLLHRNSERNSVNSYETQSHQQKVKRTQSLFNRDQDYSPSPVFDDANDSRHSGYLHINEKNGFYYTIDPQTVSKREVFSEANIRNADLRPSLKVPLNQDSLKNVNFVCSPQERLSMQKDVKIEEASSVNGKKEILDSQEKAINNSNNNINKPTTTFKENPQQKESNIMNKERNQNKRHFGSFAHSSRVNWVQLDHYAKTTSVRMDPNCNPTEFMITDEQLHLPCNLPEQEGIDIAGLLPYLNDKKRESKAMTKSPEGVIDPVLSNNSRNDSRSTQFEVKRVNLISDLSMDRVRTEVINPDEASVARGPSTCIIPGVPYNMEDEPDIESKPLPVPNTDQGQLDNDYEKEGTTQRDPNLLSVKITTSSNNHSLCSKSLKKLKYPPRKKNKSVHYTQSSSNFMNNIPQMIKNQNFANFLQSSKDPKLLKHLSMQLINNTINNAELTNRSKVSDPLRNSRNTHTNDRSVPTFTSNKNRSDSKKNDNAQYFKFEDLPIPNENNGVHGTESLLRKESIINSILPISNITSVNPLDLKRLEESREQAFQFLSSNLPLKKISSKYESKSVVSSKLSGGKDFIRSGTSDLKQRMAMSKVNVDNPEDLHNRTNKSILSSSPMDQSKKNSRNNVPELMNHTSSESHKKKQSDSTDHFPKQNKPLYTCDPHKLLHPIPLKKSHKMHSCLIQEEPNEHLKKYKKSISEHYSGPFPVNDPLNRDSEQSVKIQVLEALTKSPVISESDFFKTSSNNTSNRNILSKYSRINKLKNYERVPSQTSEVNFFKKQEIGKNQKFKNSNNPSETGQFRPTYSDNVPLSPIPVYSKKPEQNTSFSKTTPTSLYKGFSPDVIDHKKRSSNKLHSVSNPHTQYNKQVSGFSQSLLDKHSLSFIDEVQKQSVQMMSYTPVHHLLNKYSGLILLQFFCLKKQHRLILNSFKSLHDCNKNTKQMSSTSKIIASQKPDKKVPTNISNQSSTHREQSFVSNKKGIFQTTALSSLLNQSYFARENYQTKRSTRQKLDNKKVVKANGLRLKTKVFQSLKKLILKKELLKIAKRFRVFQLKQRFFKNLQKISSFRMRNSYFIQ